jgi:hypothetical protein
MEKEANRLHTEAACLKATLITTGAAKIESSDIDIAGSMAVRRFLKLRIAP